MSNAFDRAVSVRVVPSAEPAGCFHWIIAFRDGRREERSVYAYATAEGAKLAGLVRARETGGRP